MIADDMRRLNRGGYGKLIPQFLRQVTHAGKIRLTRPVYPAQQLLGAKRFLANFRTETGKRFRIEIKEIDAHKVEPKPIFTWNECQVPENNRKSQPPQFQTRLSHALRWRLCYRQNLHGSSLFPPFLDQSRPSDPDSF